MPSTQTADPAIKSPSVWLTLTELHRAMFEFSTLPLASPLLARAPRGDGHSVLVLPGFIAGDRSTDPLRRYLRQLGYDAHAWELGRNLGPFFQAWGVPTSEKARVSIADLPAWMPDNFLPKENIK